MRLKPLFMTTNYSFSQKKMNRVSLSEDPGDRLYNISDLLSHTDLKTAVIQVQINRDRYLVRLDRKN